MSLPVKHRYFYRKKYLEADSTERQEGVELAIARQYQKRRTYGLLSTPLVTSPGPGFIYQIDSQLTGPIQGHDMLGRFARADLQPYVTDDLNTPGRVGGELILPGGGNERYITLVLRYVENQAQPETEKLTFSTVFFRREAGFQIGVIQGAEAALGTAVVPSLVGENGLYLGDILVEDGDIDATATDITYDTTRATIDPLREATDRGLDGIDNRIVLTQEGNTLLRYRDVAGSNLPFEQALLGAVASPTPPSTVNRSALLSDVGGGAIVSLDTAINLGNAPGGFDSGPLTVDLTAQVIGADVPRYWIIAGFADLGIGNASVGNYAMVMAASTLAGLPAPSLAVARGTHPSIVVGFGHGGAVVFNFLTFADRNEILVPVPPGGPPYNLAYRIIFVSLGAAVTYVTAAINLRGYIK